MRIGARGALAAALIVAALWIPAVASADPGHAVRIAAGGGHTCAILDDGTVRCWGYGGDGQLGYGNTENVGDDETPREAGPVPLGGRRAIEIAAGGRHTCAILDDGAVRCWGLGDTGALGYGNTDNVGEVNTPADVGPVDIGAGRTAVEIAAGEFHTCAILDDGAVRCWGDSSEGQLGYGNEQIVGDGETPGSVGPVNLGAGRTAVAIAAGKNHTCAVLDNGAVRCWGDGADGRLGYASEEDIGDTEAPAGSGPVDVGVGRTAVSIAAAGAHTCAILDSGAVRCWGSSGNGRLGYPGSEPIGDDEAPGSAGPVDLGAGRTAIGLSANGVHTCAVLDAGTLRCWGLGDAGPLGYGNEEVIGDNEDPGDVGPVNLGAGRTATQVTTGGVHSCAILDDDSVRCWGLGLEGQLGYGNTENVGDNETPGSVGPVDLVDPLPAVPLVAIPPPPTTSLSPPVLGESVNVEPVSGTIKVRCPGDRAFGQLAGATHVPLGCRIEDRRNGTVLLIAARPGGGTESALFWAGLFRVGQPRAEVVLTMIGPLNCGKRRLSRAGSAGRKLWGSGQGNFRTVRKHGSAGVRGTIWLVADRCDDSTLFQVKKGVVTVRDFEKDVTVTLRKGKSYVAR